MNTLRNLAALAALSFAFAACDTEAASSPAGKWNLDTSETVAAMEKAINDQLAGVPADQRTAAEGMMKPMLEMMKQMKVAMDVKSDGTFTVDSTTPDGKPSKVDGTWTMTGDQITMVGKEQGSDKTDTIVGTFAGDTITCTMGEPEQKMTMVFRRQK